MKKYKLALVGATGVVGRVARAVLEQKQLPISDYCFFSSSKSAGTIIDFKGKSYEVQELNEFSFDCKFDFAIFTAGASVAEKYAPIAVKNGCTVVDNSSFYRMNPDVPLVVPEVNISKYRNFRGIIANPNCSTIQAVVALAPLDKKYGIKRIVYSTYQAVSGAGIGGIQDLQSGIEKYVYGNRYELKKFPYPIFNNCIPQIDVFLEDGYTKEEHKMINETRKILEKEDLNITATAVRVPVFNSHCESINVELENEFELKELVDFLRAQPGIAIVDNIKEERYPINLTSNEHDEVFIGRVRRDFSVKNGVNLWVVADNTRKGAAGNAIQIVEELIKARDEEQEGAEV